MMKVQDYILHSLHSCIITHQSPTLITLNYTIDYSLLSVIMTQCGWGLIKVEISSEVSVLYNQDI